MKLIKLFLLCVLCFLPTIGRATVIDSFNINAFYSRSMIKIKDINLIQFYPFFGIEMNIEKDVKNIPITFGAHFRNRGCKSIQFETNPTGDSIIDKNVIVKLSYIGFLCTLGHDFSVAQSISFRTSIGGYFDYLINRKGGEIAKSFNKGVLGIRLLEKISIFTMSKAHLDLNIGLDLDILSSTLKPDNLPMKNISWFVGIGYNYKF